MSVVQETKPTPVPRSKWAFGVGSVAGIPIRIHFTFLLFLGWIVLMSPGTGQALWIALVLAVFGCVLLHELGHALVARRFGIETRDITLYPIGGLAMLNERPKARQEIWISLAGPAVNFVIAAAIALILLIRDGGLPYITSAALGTSFWGALFAANLSLALFNLIPAFPMDGGRVLRAVLGLNMPDARATQIAASIGQALAIAFGFFGLYQGNAVFMVISFFVFLGAGQEVSASVTRSFLEGHVLREAMLSRFRLINSGASLEFAAKMLLEGSQADFPVSAGEDGDILGILTRDDIVQGLANEGPQAYVAGNMRREFQTADPNLPLEMAIDMLSENGGSPIIVMEEGKMVGMVTQENLSEFIVLEHARRQARVGASR